MAASSEVSVAQDGDQGNIKLHPYLVTLVRWCVSCLWSTATVLLHRLMVTPLQPITGPKPPNPPKPKVPKRAAGKEHLHPEPKVECQLLHQPAVHTMDVIFVHGLYGSLGNTWRQGDWRQKYIVDPQKVPLRSHSKSNTCNCRKSSFTNHIYNETKCDDNITDLNDPEMSLKKINEKLSKKVIPEENDLITEQFYNNTLMDQVEIVDNYETQAKFVRDLFKKENDCDMTHCDDNVNKCKYNDESEYDDFKCDQSDSDNNYKCDFKELNEFNECICNLEKKCEMGCGCICNDCYSDCWPKDWIKMDFPGARVISINYTSDPYLWRPLWIKENKRLNLYQRAEQMIDQLLAMGVGEKPIIWVGHSKGGLFIKQIYCEAYEAYIKTNRNSRVIDETKQENFMINKDKSNEMRNGITAENIDTIIGHFSHNNEEKKNSLDNDNDIRKYDIYTRNDDNYTRNDNNYTENNYNYIENNDNCTENNHNYIRNNDNYSESNDYYMRNIDSINKNNSCVMNETDAFNNVFEQIDDAKNAPNLENVNEINDNLYNIRHENEECEKVSTELDVENGNENANSRIEETLTLSRRASLWSSSRGFMFYSVPHRGSPLADIKTPVTARSVDLLEIAKDCPLVLELQARWLRACEAAARVAVRSFVETCRTLMSVLWLRIVSTESADAGIGALSGVSVDHREICKPSSRSCLLYTELVDLINEALQCRCQ